MKDRRSILSTMWIFVVLNYLYCDVAGLMDARLLTQYLSGVVDGWEMSESFLFSAGVLMEISISMVLLSKILRYKLNRTFNIFAGTITTLVQASTLFGGFTSYYLFFSVIEIAATAFIVWYAWAWKEHLSF